MRHNIKISPQCVEKQSMKDKDKVYSSDESNSSVKRKSSMNKKDKLVLQKSGVSTKGSTVRTCKKKKKNCLRDKVLDPNIEEPYFVCGEGYDSSFGYYDTRCFDCCKNRR